MKNNTNNRKDNLVQENGNYNVFCQSCGKIVAINVKNHEKALKLEANHSEDTQCKYTGTHLIKKQEQKVSGKTINIL